MTIDDLRANPIFMDGFSTAWPMLKRFLIARTLSSAKTPVKAERTAELSHLISELAALATPASAPRPTPKMPQLNSMSEDTET